MATSSLANFIQMSHSDREHVRDRKYNGETTPARALQFVFRDGGSSDAT